MIDLLLALYPLHVLFAPTFPNVLGELAVGGVYWVSASFGVTTELIGNLYYGAATPDTGASLIPILSLGIGSTELAIACVAIVIMEAVHLIQARWGATAFLRRMPALARYGVYAGLVGAIVYYGAYHGGGEFIYFQF